MAPFLSPEWLDEMTAAAAVGVGPEGAPFTLQQVVTGEPDGEVAWSVTIGDGAVSVARGRQDAATVTFTQDRPTAAAIHHGDLSAQTAFMTGRLRVGGDVRVLLERQDALASLDDLFAPVRLGDDLLMPELPELQAHAERLTADFGGRPLAKFRPIAFTALKTYAPAPEAAIDHPLTGVGRRGKYLLLDFETVTFVVHLMQGGRLKPDEKQSAKPRGGLARWVFADGSALLLTEAGTEKRAGVWVREGELETQEPLEGLGPDADTVDQAALEAICAAHSMRLHGLLRDQRAIAGIGRRLANEVCHQAQLSPFANASKLKPEEVARLLDAIGSCIAESLAYEHGRDDMSSSKERPGSVHHRAGEVCPVCGDIVREVEYTRYTVNYSATCQTGGKVLADNTTSKFLK